MIYNVCGGMLNLTQPTSIHAKLAYAVFLNRVKHKNTMQLHCP